jgi:hypothetical protein
MNGISDSSGSPKSFSAFCYIVTTVALFITVCGGGGLAYMYLSGILVA